MDFVVVGFGIGALAVLIGLTLHDLGPTWRRLRPNLPYSSLDVARRITWGRGCRALGRVLALAGATLCLLTLLALVLQLSDRVGAITIMIALTLVLAGVLTWAGLYAHRYHPRPLPRRPGRAATVDRPVPGTGEAVGTAPDGDRDHDLFSTPLAPTMPVFESDAAPLTLSNPADAPPTIPEESDTDRPTNDDRSDAPGSVSDEAAPQPLADHDDLPSPHQEDQPDTPPSVADPAANHHPAEPGDFASASAIEPPVAEDPSADRPDPAQAGPVGDTANDETPSLTSASKAH